MALDFSADHIASADGGFEPQRGNNFVISVALGGAGFSSDPTMIQLAMRAFSLPVGRNEVHRIKHGNTTKKVAGGHDVEDFSLTLRDYVDQDVRKLLLEWRTLVYNVDTGAMGLASAYKKIATAIVSDPGGGNQRKCKLFGIWPPADPPGGFSMDNTEPIDMEMPFVVDKLKWTQI